ncbi:MAG: adenosylcobinamide-GDP ribazoletransferase [Actinomycetota bacterium]
MSERAASRDGRRPRGFLAGVSFLTRIPVRLPIGEADVATSIAWFSVVGCLVGVASGGVFLGATELWPPLVSAVLAVAASVAITGAFHEDGLGDTADAFGAASTGRDVLPVLKDPRLGVFGVVALVGGLGLRVAGVAALTPRAGLLALIAAHALARGMSAAVVVSAPSAATGLGSSYAALAPRWRGWIALAVGVGVATACLGIAGLIAAGIVGVCAVALARWAARTLGGVSGDVLGAIEQVGEIVTLLVSVAAIGRGVVGPFA